MKILDRYLLKTFTSTLATVFVILFFIFILQTVWLFISELAGKDLDFISVLKFLMFSMPRIVPLVLPLSILLASIMTFGDLSENYEFAAMKSSGISLQRSMKTLIIFMFFLSIVAFIFANNVIPYAEYKFINFRKEIAQRTPAMAIAEGQFNELGNFNIKVDKKSGEKGNYLKGVTIHKKNINQSGSKTVIKSKTGELVSNDKSNNLQLVLFDGYYYEDIVPKNYEDRSKLPFGKSSFKKYIINIDLTLLNNPENDQGEITNTNNMLNVAQLKYTLDSLNLNLRKDKISFADNSYLRTGITNGSVFSNYADTSTTKKKNSIPLNILSHFGNQQKTEIIKTALSNLENSGYSVDSAKTDFENKQKTINAHWIALYEKFAIAFSCILMFFIGAPLGSIIRKGGLGLPIVFAVTIFIIYHFANTFGKRVSQENGMPAFLGAWISTIIMTPLAVLLTYRAIKDIGGIMNFDAITLFFEKLFPKNKDNKNNVANIDQKENLLVLHKQYQVFSLVAIGISVISFFLFFNLTKDHTSQKTVIFCIVNLLLYASIYVALQKSSTIENLVSKQFDPDKTITFVLGFPLYGLAYFVTNKSIVKAIAEYKFAPPQTIDKTETIAKKPLRSIKDLELVTDYNLLSSKTLAVYIVAIISSIFSLNNPNKYLLTITIILILILALFVYFSQKKLEILEKNSSQKFDPGMAVSLILAFPLYPIVYYVNRKTINSIN